MAQATTPEEVLRSDPFYSPDTNLDLSAFPWLRPLADAPVDDGKFAQLDRRGMGMGSSDLKKFLTNPDRESVAELRDPEALKKYDEQHGSGTTVYASNVPFQISQRGGKWRAQGKTPDGTVHRFTADTRDGLFPKITNAVSETSVRELSDGERLQVVRIAQSGDPRGAISKYLEFSIGQRRASSYGDAEELLADPRLAQVFDECSMLTWFASRPRVEDSDEFQEFLQRYRGGRPLNHDLLDGAYAAFSNERNRIVFAEPPRDEGTTERALTAADLENLSDEQIEAQVKQQAQYNAQNAHRPRAPYPGGTGYEEAAAVAVHA
jgi:hypothetical protein